MTEDEHKFSPEQEGPLTVNEYERFGAHVREVLGEFTKELVGEPTRIVLSLEYVSPEGKTFDVKSLLPKDFSLMRNNDDYIHSVVICDTKQMIYGGRRNKERTDDIAHYEDQSVWGTGNIADRSKPAIPERGFFLTLLHELGHSDYFSNLSETEKQVVIEDIKNYKRDIASDDIDKSRTAQQRLIQRERYAWAWALRTLRNLRKDGIDLAPEYTGNKQIFEFIDLSLSTRKPLLPPDELVRILETLRREYQ
ncbi:MAG: hypothetical protein A3A80_00730 [Candidatus Terrybacteria bacterium RIFCSPLOWO2_01_FULL_44_24]|uniref:Uncharacterized protein n=1 Tax=Candidatus Terrybacteria bacterium RIFCSPHIGHO2_01_FULL_43_35 TaxID=1802361 RepID=A0A1G2PCQ9_9BACT|nr:MAG: hypothetical protein A2828_02735 [Candidatus Terrybacteria bacterium RIFCSPHIGHO2_01_FULL_43_35]OHA49515.1 MAG: hypothetical protein A3B75_00060 [Candidatus Terrybacteria bacterium RIFCSPHIGHO2_02_FULL_43_14]OHA51449.1 MAG: hypothetical protein A3A80_00730 [Candidatus Terrybacteria bacterium RIFCSPLOWO2_01_FULL_44_24]